MASRYPSTSSSSDNESSDDSSPDLEFYYCRAITNLTGKIADVIQHDKSVFAEAYGQALIPEEIYVLEDTAKQARGLLAALRGKIKVDPRCYNTFLTILRGSTFTEKLADVIEAEVNKLQKPKQKKKKSNLRSTRGAIGSSSSSSSNRGY